MSKSKILAGFFALLIAGSLWAGGKTESTQVYNLRLATVVNQPHPWVEAANYLAEQMAARTKGAVQIKVFTGGQLGTDDSTFEDMRIGTLDLQIGGATTLTKFITELGVLNMPYFYRDLDQFRKVMAPRGEIVNLYRQIFEQKNLGVKLLTLGGGGARALFNNQRAITEPGQLKGVKMRVPNNPEDAKLWGSVGAVTTGMPISEVYTALQSGVINAFENTITNFTASKYYEVAKFMSNTQHQYMSSHFLVSEITWNKLPPEYRKILDELSDEVARMFTDKGEESDKVFIEDLRGYGVTVSEVNKPAFMQAFQPMQDQIAAGDKTGRNTEILAMLRRVRDN